ncbi:hypothetical protein ACLB2K_056020 [Fragaria x ananassa]
MAPTTACLHPSSLQQRPRSLSLPGEITQNFKQNRSCRGGKVIRDAAGGRWGGGAASSEPYGGERRHVRTLRVCECLPLIPTMYIYIYIQAGSGVDVHTALKVRTSLPHCLAQTTAHLYPSGHRRHPRSLFLPDESAEFQFSSEIDLV